MGLQTLIGKKKKTKKKFYWGGKWECGNVKGGRLDIVFGGDINSGGGIKKRKRCRKQTGKHRHKMSGTRIYQEWQGMKGRCYNPHNPNYYRWGGRGITICDEWRNSFEAFYEWAMANGYKDDLTIDRIDNDGNYCPDNCRWATQSEQSRNRSSNIRIKIGNSTRTLTEWCEIFGVNFSAIHARYQKNGFASIDDLFN